MCQSRCVKQLCGLVLLVKGLIELQGTQPSIGWAC